jgi:hypothetical protein
MNVKAWRYLRTNRERQWLECSAAEERWRAISLHNWHFSRGGEKKPVKAVKEVREPGCCCGMAPGQMPGMGEKGGEKGGCGNPYPAWHSANSTTFSAFPRQTGRKCREFSRGPPATHIPPLNFFICDRNKVEKAEKVVKTTENDAPHGSWHTGNSPPFTAFTSFSGTHHADSHASLRHRCQQLHVNRVLSHGDSLLQHG